MDFLIICNVESWDWPVEMFDHVAVALLVAVQQGLGVTAVQGGQTGQSRQSSGQPRQHPGPGQQGIVQRHQVGHRVTHGEPRASALNMVAWALPREHVRKRQLCDFALPWILFMRDERGSVELQHGVLRRGAGEWEHSLGWPARSGGLHQYITTEARDKYKVLTTSTPQHSIYPCVKSRKSSSSTPNLLPSLKIMQIYNSNDLFWSFLSVGKLYCRHLN